MSKSWRAAQSGSYRELIPTFAGSSPPGLRHGPSSAWKSAGGDFDSEVYQERRERLIDRIEAGDYDWGFPLDPNSMGEAVLKARSTGEGQARLTQLLLEKHHGEVEVAQIVAAFQDNKEGFQRALARALDPNSASPSTDPTETETGKTEKPSTQTTA